MSLELDVHPNTIASQISGRDYLSFSSLAAFQRCPLAWKFKYVDSLPEETVSTSLALGGAIHAAAEFHFNELMVGSPVPHLATLLSVFWDAWHDRGEEVTIRLGKGEDVNTIGKTAERILAAFQLSELSQPQGQIIGVEEQLRGELVQGVPDLLARIDLIVESSDAVTITDLKTARSRWSAGQAEDAGEQLLLYGELARSLSPNKPVRLEFAVITKTAKPTVERWPVMADAQRVARTKRVVERTWKAIES